MKNDNTVHKCVCVCFFLNLIIPWLRRTNTRLTCRIEFTRVSSEPKTFTDKQSGGGIEHTSCHACFRFSMPSATSAVVRKTLLRRERVTRSPPPPGLFWIFRIRFLFFAARRPRATDIRRENVSSSRSSWYG